MTIKRVYVSGPYTLGDPCINTNTAIAAGNAILDAGHAPFVPHLSHFWHTVTPRSYTDWMLIDLAFVPQCDVLLRLPGVSSGADIEVECANEHKVPVVYSMQELLELLAVL